MSCLSHERLRELSEGGKRTSSERRLHGAYRVPDGVQQWYPKGECLEDTNHQSYRFAVHCAGSELRWDNIIRNPNDVGRETMRMIGIRTDEYMR